MRNRSPFTDALVALATLATLATLGACTAKSDAKAHSHAEGQADHDHGEQPSAKPGSPSEPKPHGDHNPRHGGVVMMTADMHLEALLGSDGKHQIYWSDGARDPLAASSLEKVTLTIVRPGEAAEEVALARDATDKLWEGQGKPLAEPAKADITVMFTKPGQAPTPQKIVFPQAHPGHGGEGHAAAGEHTHQAPHGGQIESTQGGHLELLGAPDGSFKLWLLDANLAPRPVAGVTATVKVAVAGYADVALAVVGDHLEGKGAAIAGEHVPAAVSVKIGAVAETARFTLHFAGAGHQH